MIKTNSKISKLLISIKSDKTLYYLWYRLHLRGLKINWFKDETAFFFDGYPRSGNTFMLMLIQKVFQNVDTVHHCHSIGALKIALDKNLPSFILYRKPKDAILSNYLKENSGKGREEIDVKRPNTRLLKYHLICYISYYKNVYKYRNDLKLISFDKLINKPQNVIMAINEKLPMQHKKSQSEINSIVSEVKNIKFGAQDILGASQPNQTKEKYKNELFPFLSDFSHLEIADNIYHKIKTAHNNV